MKILPGMSFSHGEAYECSDHEDDDDVQLRCWDCCVNFTSEHYLYQHLFHHIKQPYVRLVRCKPPPLKLTLTHRNGNFEIVGDANRTADAEAEDGAAVDMVPLKTDRPDADLDRPAFELVSDKKDETDEMQDDPFDMPASDIGYDTTNDKDPLLDGAGSDLGFSSDFDDINGLINGDVNESMDEGTVTDASASHDDASQGATLEEIIDDVSNHTGGTISPAARSSDSRGSEYAAVAAATTPDPSPSPLSTTSSNDYPKIRIKTGLLKDPMTDEPQTCTITEITDDGQNADPLAQDNSNSLWSSQSNEDPLKLPEADDNILSLFNNNDRAKDFGFTSSESEFISLDRLDEHSNRNALQLYNPPSSSMQAPLDQLTGLPMQALAQQVSRLQPNNGMHQQNVLINIQQFSQGPPQAPYQPPSMYHHGPPAQPMYPPYQYQPPNPMYYPPAPSYGQPMPPQMAGPPPPMQQPHVSQPMSQSMPVSTSAPHAPPPQQQQHTPPRMPPQMATTTAGGHHPVGGYRPPMRHPAPRQPMTGQQRMPMGPRQGMAPRQGMVPRQRAPMVRSRAPNPLSQVRGPRPRLPNAPPHAALRSPLKRHPDALTAASPAKKKRFDLLNPDKDDDDCQVICTQPKSEDGLPQIESVQGGTAEPLENSIMHLSDSITLSVRNPPPRPASPKKSDAKAVANILATRGITVTATAKPKEKLDAKGAQPPLNLNGSVSIIPSAKQNAKPHGESLPTVDLTDDPGPPPSTASKSANPQKASAQTGLPYRCDLCSATYPNALGLSRHRQHYHKTAPSQCDLGIPLVNLKQQGALQRLAALGVTGLIPLPQPRADGTFAIPIISTRNPGNVAALGAHNMLVLGPVKPIPRPAQAKPLQK